MMLQWWMTIARRQNPAVPDHCFLSSAETRSLIMEIVAQWLDDLDDVVSALRLLSERLRSFCISLIFFGTALLMQIAGVLLALEHPPLACALATIMLVILVYRSATAPHPAIQQIT